MIHNGSATVDGNIVSVTQGGLTTFYTKENLWDVVKDDRNYRFHASGDISVNIYAGVGSKEDTKNYDRIQITDMPALKALLTAA